MNTGFKLMVKVLEDHDQKIIRANRAIKKINAATNRNTIAITFVAFGLIGVNLLRDRQLAELQKEVAILKAEREEGES